MCAHRNASPVIIKRKKKVTGGGHHGGAWKVAYADFVTAMMAFFMLMWLLNATTEKQRKGIADYFSPSIPISRVSGGGDGMFGGEDVTSHDPAASDRGGDAPSAGLPGPTDAAAPADSFREEMKQLEADLLGRGGESMASDSVARHIVTRVSDEGLIVEIFDLPDAPLFAEGTAEPAETTREIAAVVVRAFALAGNPVAVNGHVRSYTRVLRHDPAWELSAERAMAMRLLLEAKGLAPVRVQRVAGYADRKAADPNPMSVRNNRLELILLRRRD